MFERTLDDAGEPVDTEAMLAPIGSDPVLVRGEPPQLAFNGGDQKWRVATLAPDGRSFAREVALPLAGSFVTAAPSRDGLLAIGFDSDVSEDTAVPPTKAAAVFVPLGGEPGHPIDVMFGEKHTSWVPFPLVSPGYAAVLVLTQGYGPAGGELVTLREPCAR
jgi:hypothetical protein